MSINTEPPPLPHNLLEEVIQEEDGFRKYLHQEYAYEAGAGFYDLLLSDRVVHDVYECYTEDAERLAGKMPTVPDHFKHAGILAYWLRRHNPILSWKETGVMPHNEYASARDFLMRYGHVYLAFAYGYRICLLYVRESTGGKTMPELTPNPNYIESICNLMKYKSVSPHSLGFIYRSLFFGFG